MTPLLIMLVLSAPPVLESRLFIATGAKTEAEAKKALTAVVLPEGLVLRKGFPQLVESKSIPGLNPGFWLVVLGACDDVGRWPSHNDGLAALIQRGLKGAYAKPVGKQPASCPLWFEGKDAGLRDHPDEVKRLKPAAAAMHKEGNLLGADILLRRAVALGDEDKETLDLLRTVEFLLEDAPFRLP
jgi:hypothetical protein